jgi:hypothetical protein
MELSRFLTVTAALGTLITLGLAAIALVRLAQRTNRRVWLWLLGTYIAANIVWAILRPFLAQP